ncbi:MAG: tetratricopeptide repeat protein [Anaerolineae bacterium]|nr:tetratricopeptide repeat protein [Anaerolineae bacterium]
MIDTFGPVTPPLVGRERELEELREILLATEARLLTILGPGGTGKTRLAQALAAQLMAQFTDGAHIVYLQPLSSASLMPQAVADALGLPSGVLESPDVQVLRHLKDKQLLLIFDNYEHLLPHVEFITALLAQTRRVRLIVTSREVLNLRDEWLYPLEGLVYPAQTRPPHGDIASYSAAQLFARHAQRARPDFSIVDEGEAVARICRAVQGMPLAIELAASWVKTLGCDDVAVEIERNLDFLATNLRDFPARHRSVRAVFDQSWARLSDDERDVFKRLSVFQGGFQRDAAERIAGASLASLASLVEKSLIQRDADGRYQLHDLLRQYAQQQLAAALDEDARTRAAHTDYYITYLAARERDLLGGRQRDAIAELTAEQENIRRAWAHTLETVAIEAIARVVWAYQNFCDMRSRFLEAVQLTEAAHRVLLAQPRLDQRGLMALAITQVALGWAYVRLARTDDARAAFEHSYALHERHGFTVSPGLGSDPEAGLGMVALVAGDYAAALEHAQRLLKRAQADGDDVNEAVARYLTCGACMAQGDYNSALHHVRQAVSLAKTMDNDWFMAYCLIEMGNVMVALGDLSAARRHFEDAYRLRADSGDPQGSALALAGLGKVQLLQGRPADARRSFEQSTTIYRDTYDYGGLVTTLNGLGVAAHSLGDLATAHASLREALDIALENDLIPNAIGIFAEIGGILVHARKPQTGVALLAFVLQQPARPQETTDRASLFLHEAEAMLNADAFAAARADAPGNLSAAADLAHTALLAETSNAPVTSPTASAHHDALVEPLSERELEVLRLLADGFSNQEIAERLVLALGTVKAHNHNIFSKLGVGNRVRAIARAKSLGLIERDS